MVNYIVSTRGVDTICVLAKKKVELITKEDWNNQNLQGTRLTANDVFMFLESYEIKEGGGLRILSVLHSTGKVLCFVIRTTYFNNHDYSLNVEEIFE